MARPTRVLFLIPHLGGGGAEHVTELLVRRISPQRFDVHLAVVTQAEVDKGRFPGSVAVHPLGARRVRAAAMRLLCLINRVRPDVIVSGMAHLNFLVLLLRPLLRGNPRVLIRQNGTVSAVLREKRVPGGTAWLYRFLYPRASAVICQSRAMAEDLIATSRVPRAKIAVLDNPVDFKADLAAGKEALWRPGAGPHLLAVGRLAPEKGFDLLLDALPWIQKEFPAVDLIIAGSGGEHLALRAQSRRLGLSDRVHFAGYLHPPYALFPSASIFVLPSRHEGMPNALLEAGAGGLPIVALPCSGGVIDLVTAWQGAWLAANISAEALAEALLTALRAIVPGQRYPRTFHDEDAIAAYEQLIEASALTGHA